MFNSLGSCLRNLRSDSKDVARYTSVFSSVCFAHVHDSQIPILFSKRILSSSTVTFTISFLVHAIDSEELPLTSHGKVT